MQISARKGVKFYQKEAISLEVEPARPQAELVVPLSVVRGEALMLAVQPGSRVEKYQVLARPEGEGCPVYAPVSGRFAEVVERRVPGLGKTPCARIEPEPEKEDKARPKRRTGRYTAAGGLQVSEERGQRKDLTLRRLVGIAKRAAIVDEKDGRRLWKKLEELEEGEKPAWVYADGIDDQPFMAAGLAVLSSFGAQVAAGLRMLCQALSAQGGILARAGEEADALLSEEYFGFPVEYIRGKYPSAPAVDAFLESLHGIRFGVGALLALCRAVEDGTPQTTAVVTVAGDGVQAPLHIEAPLGVTVGGLLEQCGAFGVIQRVVAGGVMTGRITGPQSPLHPGITALTAQAVVTEPPHTTCTGCGRCAQVCPAGLAPFYLYRVAKKSSPARLEELGGWQCMECGCCSYVCPSGLPLAACTRWIRRTLEAAEKKGTPRHVPPDAAAAGNTAEQPAATDLAHGRPMEKAQAAGKGESGPATAPGESGKSGQKGRKGFGKKTAKTEEPMAADTGRLPSVSGDAEAADGIPPAKKRKGSPAEAAVLSGNTAPEDGKKRKRRSRTSLSGEGAVDRMTPEEGGRKTDIPAAGLMQTAGDTDGAEAETSPAKKRRRWGRSAQVPEEEVQVLLTADLDFIEEPAGRAGKRRRNPGLAEASPAELDTAHERPAAEDSPAAAEEINRPAAGRKGGRGHGKNQ